MKKKRSIFLIGIAFFFMGCSTSMIGKKVPDHSLRPLSIGKGTYSWEGGDVLDYYYEDNRLTGKLIFAERSGASGHEITNLTLVAWFANWERIIQTKASYSWKHSDSKSMDEGLDFVIVIPDGFNNLAFVGFTYQGTYIH
jgi:hypothetical protein